MAVKPVMRVPAALVALAVILGVAGCGGCAGVDSSRNIKDCEGRWYLQPPTDY
jgi:hypothetical protein